jgi:hypothetical protein
MKQLERLIVVGNVFGNKSLHFFGQRFCASGKFCSTDNWQGFRLFLVPLIVI